MQFTRTPRRGDAYHDEDRYALSHRLLLQAGGAPGLRSIWKRYASLAKPLPPQGGVAPVQHGSGTPVTGYAGDRAASAVNPTYRTRSGRTATAPTGPTQTALRT